MNVRIGLSTITRVHSGPKRWVNLPYALVVACVLLLGLAEEEESAALLPYLVLLPLFAVQLLWPTVAGWAGIVGAWFVLIFLAMLRARLFFGITEFNNWVLIFFGLAPLIPLYIFRPRLQDVRGAGGPKEEDPPQGDTQRGDGA